MGERGICCSSELAIMLTRRDYGANFRLRILAVQRLLLLSSHGATRLPTTELRSFHPLVGCADRNSRRLP
jgi:hypothetical protein